MIAMIIATIIAMMMVITIMVISKDNNTII
jgi:hypothetical protein